MTIAHKDKGKDNYRYIDVGMLTDKAQMIRSNEITVCLALE